MGEVAGTLLAGKLTGSGGAAFVLEPLDGLWLIGGFFALSIMHPKVALFGGPFNPESRRLIFKLTHYAPRVNGQRRAIGICSKSKFCGATATDLYFATRYSGI